MLTTRQFLVRAALVGLSLSAFMAQFALWAAVH